MKMNIEVMELRLLCQGKLVKNDPFWLEFSSFPETILFIFNLKPEYPQKSLATCGTEKNKRFLK
jgi:hypothetical protein